MAKRGIAFTVKSGGKLSGYGTKKSKGYGKTPDIPTYEPSRIYDPLNSPNGESIKTK